MKKCKIGAFVTLLLIVCILVTGIFAYLTDSDKAINRFTGGNINIKLMEEFDTNGNGIIEDNEIYAHEKTPVYKDIVPNKKVIKAPWIKNTGKNDAYLFMSVGIPKEEVINAELSGERKSEEKILQEVFTINDVDTTNWKLVQTDTSHKDYNYYLYFYKLIVHPEEQTSKLFKAVKLINIAADQDDELFETSDILIDAYAIQSDGVYGTNSQIWQTYLNSVSFTNGNNTEPSQSLDNIS